MARELPEGNKDVPLMKIDSANPDHLLDIDRPEDFEKFLNEV